MRAAYFEKASATWMASSRVGVSTSTWTCFALMSMFGYETRGAYVELLGQWGIVVMTAYFGGRSLEKVMERKDKMKLVETELKSAK